jgi:cytochrome bd-type quinol oxidase subunit 1
MFSVMSNTTDNDRDVTVDLLKQWRDEVKTGAVFTSKETVRFIIVLGLVGIFATTVVWAFLRTGSGSWHNAKNLLDLLLPAETALLGTVVAFYMTETRPGGPG